MEKHQKIILELLLQDFKLQVLPTMTKKDSGVVSPRFVVWFQTVAVV